MPWMNMIMNNVIDAGQLRYNITTNYFVRIEEVDSVEIFHSVVQSNFN